MEETPKSETQALRVDSLAYWDTFAGLVPVTVLSIRGKSGPACSSQRVHFRVNADCGPYKRGEQHTRSALWIVPRFAVRRGKYSTWILPRFVECNLTKGGT